jgi:RNA polymerase sigma factor (sigma-70 family)
MASRPANLILRHVRDIQSAQAREQLSDRELLHRFARGDETAFASLVRRHGAMVLGVGRRVLHQTADAEDVFQATFLTLARRAGSRRWHASVGNWLYLVAHRLALSARADSERRARHEAQGRVASPADPLAEVSGRELCAILDEEVARLPERLRGPLVLCCLEGQTRDEAARSLSWSLGTLKRRLEQGRALLRTRLEKRGVTLPAALAGALVAEGVSQAAIPAALITTVLTAAMTGTAASARVLALAQPFLHRTIFFPLRATAAVLLAASLIGGLGLAFGLSGDGKPQPVAREPGAMSEGARVDQYGDPLPAGAFARLGTKRFRHQNTVRSVAFSKDGTRLISASWDGTMRVWDADTGRELHRFRQPGGASAAISPDGKTVASGGIDKSFHVWDLASGKELFQAANLENTVMSIQFAPDGKTLATLSGPVIRIWDVAAGKELSRVEQPEEGLYSMAFSPDGKFLAGGLGGYSVRLWDGKTGKELYRLEGHDAKKSKELPWVTDFYIYAVAFAPDGKTLASAGSDYDRTIRFWDLATGKEMRRIAVAPGWVRPIAFSPDGKLLASGGTQSTVRLFDVATGQEVSQCQLPGRKDTWVMAVAFSPDGKRLATSGTEKVIRLWDVVTGKEIVPYEGHQDTVSQVAISPDGRTVLTAGNDGLICRWDRSTGRIIWQTRQSFSVSDMVASPDGKIAVTAGAEPEVVRLWDTVRGKEIRTLRGPKGWIRAIALSPDSSVVAVAAWDRTIRLWGTSNGEERLKIVLPSTNKDYRGDCPLAFTPDGKTLLSGSADHTNDILYLWDATTGRELRQIKQPASRLAVSPDGRTLATLSRDRNMHLWDITSGKELRRIDKAGGCMAFAPDGRSLATGDGLAVIHLWELATGAERRSLLGHESDRDGENSVSSGVTSLAFSADGKTLISGGGDTTALIWEIRATNGERRPTEPLWAALAEADATRAYDASCALATSPNETVQFLESRLHAVVAPDPQRVTQLIADLDSERFDVRAQVGRELENLGEGVVPALRKALENKPSAELRRRAEQLIDKLTSSTPSGHRLQALRAVEVLEWIGCAEARPLLAELAKGLPEAQQTREAKAALDRLAKR